MKQVYILSDNFGIIKIAVLLSLIIFFLLLVTNLIKNQQKWWLSYPIILSLYPIYMINYFTRRVPDTNLYIRIFLPILCLTTFILFAWISKKVVLREDIYIQKGPTFYPFLFFILANLISLFKARDINSGLIIISAWTFIFLSYIVIYNTIDDIATMKNFIFMLIVACVFLSLLGMYKLFITRDTVIGVNPFISYSANYSRGAYFEKNNFAFFLEEVFL